MSLINILKIFSGTIVGLVIAVIVLYFIARRYFYNIPILMYHHINYSEKKNSLYVTPERFFEQIEFIASHGYNVLTLDEFIEYLMGQKKIEHKNLVLITFDDGCKSNYVYAYKKLKEHKKTGLFFIPVNKIGNKRYLTKEDILEMKKNGMIFGSHTLNECYLPDLSQDEAKKEIFESKHKLEKLIGKEVKAIAYCVGGYTKKIIELVQKAGYEIAFTTNRGFDKNCKNNSIYQLRRIKITDNDNNFKLWAKLAGIYNLFKSIKEPN